MEALFDDKLRLLWGYRSSYAWVAVEDVRLRRRPAGIARWEISPGRAYDRVSEEVVERTRKTIGHSSCFGGCLVALGKLQ
jgi:hypothetical protein